MSAVSVLGAIVVAGCAGVSRGPVTIGVTTTSSSLVADAPPVEAPVPTTTVSHLTTVPRLTTAPRPPTPVRPGVTASTARRSPTTSVAAPPRCPSTLAGQLASTGGGSQLITVVAGAAGSTSATLTLWQTSGGCWAPAGGPWPARVGVHGLSTHHREGDGTTPVGLFALSSAFYGLAPDPGVHGRYHRLTCGDWWDEDPASPQYNTFQHLACGANPPFGGQSEALWTKSAAYQRFAVVSYNTGPVVPGAGSAIFVHDDDGAPTNGCISLPPDDLDSLLRWLQPGQARIAIGTSGGIGQL